MNRIKIVLPVLAMIFAAYITGCKNESLNHVQIDPDQKGEVINEYIYGQFIEHLGNCIYNGIWAEMLEDRKFYYPVTDDFLPYSTATDPFWNTGPYQFLSASPWEVTGPERSVVMQKKNSYVGEFSPEITCRAEGQAGIRQYGIGIIKGKDYEGHIVIKGTEGVWPVRLKLVVGSESQEIALVEEAGVEYTTKEFRFTSTLRGSASLEIYSEGEGSFTIGTISMMPADNINGWRADVVGLLKELNAPIYRWPGGNFVSGYDWRDGIGDRDRRPPRKNPAWKGVEHNDVGIHEYMNLMDIIDAEAFIAVNTGSGNPQQVAEEVAYCRADTNHPMGRWRMENGNQEPFAVKYWAVGNEMYGNWQIGHMPLEDYVKKHNETAEEIWKVDSLAQLIGVGALGEWSRTMLKICSDHMNLISEHHYSKEIDTSLTAHVNQIAEAVRNIAENHRNYRNEIPELEGKDIRVALDEWNYWYGDYIYGELGVRYHMKDALGIAKGLHEMFRNSDIYYMANYAQTVNVIGCIKTTDTTSGFASTGQVLKLYRNHFGKIPLKTDFSSDVADFSAALDEENNRITIAIVNSGEEELRFALELKGLKIIPDAHQWLIANSDPEAFNEPGEPEKISIQEKDVRIRKNIIEVPSMSILLTEIKLKE